MLGCGEYEVFLQRRGGGKIVGLLDFETLSYGRKVDDIYQGSVTVGSRGVADEACCMVLSQIEGWQHEISVRRDGEEVFCGPTQDPDFGDDKCVITFRDLFSWMDVRVIHNDHHPRSEDLGRIFQAVLMDALEPDTSPNIACVTTDTGIYGDRDYLAADYMIAGDALRELARTGVDFTAVGRSLYCGGIELSQRALPTLYEGMLINPHAIPKGSMTATRAIVRGQTVSGQTVAGSAGGPDETLGLVERVYDEGTIPDQGSADAAATTRNVMLCKAPVYLSGALDPSTPVKFARLIPGVRWPASMDVECRHVEGIYRLEALDVVVSNSDAGQTETVTPTLIPIGSVQGS